MFIPGKRRLSAVYSDYSFIRAFAVYAEKTKFGQIEHVLNTV